MSPTSFDPAPFSARRQTLLKQLGDGVALIPTAPECVRNRDSLYPYRFDSYFWYLSGFPEPEAVIVLVQCRSSDPEVRQRLTQEVTDLLRLRHSVEPQVKLVGGHALPQTSSGKLSRSRAKAAYLAELGERATA